VWTAVRTQAEQEREAAAKSKAHKQPKSLKAHKPTTAEFKSRGTALAAAAAKDDVQPNAQAQQKVQQQQRLQQAQAAQQQPATPQQPAPALNLQSNAQPYSVYFQRNQQASKS
jgi:hypothetical protein